MRVFAQVQVGREGEGRNDSDERRRVARASLKEDDQARSLCATASPRLSLWLVEGCRALSTQFAGVKLEARIANQTRGGIAIVFCAPLPPAGNMYVPEIGALQARLVAEGYCTVRFNFRGVGSSEGNAYGRDTWREGSASQLTGIDWGSPLLNF